MFASKVVSTTKKTSIHNLRSAKIILIEYPVVAFDQSHVSGKTFRIRPTAWSEDGLAPPPAGEPGGIIGIGIIPSIAPPPVMVPV